MSHFLGQPNFEFIASPNSNDSVLYRHQFRQLHHLVNLHAHITYWKWRGKCRRITKKLVKRSLWILQDSQDKELHSPNVQRLKRAHVISFFSPYACKLRESKTVLDSGFHMQTYTFPDSPYMGRFFLSFSHENGLFQPVAAKKTRTGQTLVLPTIQPRIQSLVHNPFGFKAEQT